MEATGRRVQTCPDRRYQPTLRGLSVLDTITDCGGAAPDQADPAILTTIRKKVRGGTFEGITDLSQGGLLDALAVLTPHANVKPTGDKYEKLFSETYSRFLVAVNNESTLKGLNYTLIEDIRGSSLRITIGDQYLEISDAERESALVYLTAIMRGLMK